MKYRVVHGNQESLSLIYFNGKIKLICLDAYRNNPLGLGIKDAWKEGKVSGIMPCLRRDGEKYIDGLALERAMGKYVHLFKFKLQ